MPRATRLLIFFILIPSLAYVQEKKKESDQSPVKDPSFVEEVVVTGELVAETATVVNVTREQIKKQGAKNVAEALEYIPGAHIRVGGSGAAYIRLRGFRQREAALLIDGIPVHSP